MRSICRTFVMLFVMLLIPVGCLAASRPTRQTPRASKSFGLEVLATTMTQIVVQWKGEPAGTASFELERATNASFTANVKTYALDKGTYLFSDTDRVPVSRNRFSAADVNPGML